MHLSSVSTTTRRLLLHSCPRIPFTVPALHRSLAGAPLLALLPFSRPSHITKKLLLRRHDTSRHLCISAAFRQPNPSAFDMEVTRHNFDTMLPLVREALAECHFFAIDCEMTGLFLEGGGNDRDSGKPPAYLDDIEDRYEEMLASAGGFTITQFGLSAFEWKGGWYRTRTFNFYTFPRPFEGHDVRFVSQAASLDFLASCDFDFNKWIKEGISYMPVSLRDAKLAAVDRMRDRPDILVTKDADVALVEALVESVTAWLAAPDGSTGTDDEGLVLLSANSYQRALQYQSLRRDQFGAAQPPGFLVERIKDEEGRPALRLLRASPADVAAHAAEQREQRLAGIHAAAGFAAVLEAMRDCNKPAIGHNLSFDLAYTLRSFAQQQLPPTWEEYKQLVQRWFPGGVYDTKYLAGRLPEALPDTGLGALHEALLVRRRQQAQQVAAAMEVDELEDAENVEKREEEKEEEEEEERVCVIEEILSAAAAGLPDVGHAEGYERYEDASTKQYAHEAGFDAFMTGAVFACLVRLNEATAAAAGGTTKDGGTESALPDGGAAVIVGEGGASMAAEATAAGDASVLPAAATTAANAVENASVVTAAAAGADAEGEMAAPLAAAVQSGLAASTCPQLAAVEALCWRMNLSRSDIAHAALKGVDPRPDRSRVLLLTGLEPGTLRNGGDVARALTATGGGAAGGRVRAALVEGGAAALVEFESGEAAQAGRELLQGAFPGCGVQAYEAFQAVKAGRRAAEAEAAEQAKRAGRRGAKRPREGPAVEMEAGDMKGTAEEQGGSRMCAIM